MECFCQGVELLDVSVLKVVAVVSLCKVVHRKYCQWQSSTLCCMRASMLVLYLLSKMLCHQWKRPDIFWLSPPEHYSEDELGWFWNVECWEAGRTHGIIYWHILFPGLNVSCFNTKFETILKNCFCSWICHLIFEHCNHCIFCEDFCDVHSIYLPTASLNTDTKCLYVLWWWVDVVQVDVKMEKVSQSWHFIIFM